MRVLGIDPVQSSVRRLIGYVPQVLSADQWLSGRENLRLFADLHHVPWRRRNQRVDELLESMGLASVAGEPPDLTARSDGRAGKLEDVFIALTGDTNEQRGGMRDVARVRRTARRPR